MTFSPPKRNIGAALHAGEGRISLGWGFVLLRKSI